MKYETINHKQDVFIHCRKVVFIGIITLLSGCNNSSSNNDDTGVTTNTPPTANAGVDQNLEEGSTVELAGSGSDAEGSVTFTWTQTTGPTVTLNNSDTATASFEAPDVSVNTQLEFTLTVTDSEGLTASDAVAITVEDVPPGANTPPTANAGADQTVNEEENVTLTGTGSDTEGTVTYLWTQNAGSAVVINDDNMATANFVAPEVSAETLLTFELTVTDEGALSSSDSVNITVMDVVDPPPGTAFNRRLKVLRFDLDNNGTDDAVQTYMYNADSRIGSSIYSYTADGSDDIDYDRFPINVGDEDETQTFTYDANDDVSNWDLEKTSGAFKLEFDWNETGKINNLQFDVFSGGTLQSSIGFDIAYSSGLLSAVDGSGSGVSLDLLLSYDGVGVLQSDLQTVIAAGTTQERQQDYSWNTDGAIENMLEFSPDPADDFERNINYDYDNDRLTEVVHDSDGEIYSWDYSYSADGLLETIYIDLENDGVYEAKIKFEWEVSACEESIVWLLRGVPETSKRLTDTLPYTLGDGHFTIPVCGNVAP